MIGSLLDLLPKPRTTEYMALPEFVRREIELIRKGGRPLSVGELSDHAILPKRVDMLAAEIKNIGAQIADIHTGQSELGGKMIPILEAVFEQVQQIGARVTAAEADISKLATQVASHSVKHVAHDAKHAELAEHITGVFKRLTIIETSRLTKRNPRKKAKRP